MFYVSSCIQLIQCIFVPSGTLRDYKYSQTNMILIKHRHILCNNNNNHHHNDNNNDTFNSSSAFQSTQGRLITDWQLYLMLLWRMCLLEKCRDCSLLVWMTLYAKKPRQIWYHVPFICFLFFSSTVQHSDTLPVINKV